MVRLNTTNNEPIHLPKINPPSKAIGVPNPRSETQKIVNTKKINIKIINLFCFNKFK